MAYPQSHPVVPQPVECGTYKAGGRDGACVLGRIVRAFRLTNIQLGRRLVSINDGAGRLARLMFSVCTYSFFLGLPSSVLLLVYLCRTCVGDRELCS